MEGYKHPPTQYKGISFIVISELSADQAQTIRQNLPLDHIFKISTKDGLIENCVLYDHYSDWFDQVFIPAYKIAINKPIKTEEIPTAIKL